MWPSESCWGALGTQQLLVLSTAMSSYSEEEQDEAEQRMAQLEQESFCCHPDALCK